MSKIATVTRAEYLKAVRTKAFLIGIILMPVIWGGSIIALILAEKAKDVTPRHFAVVDRTGRLFAPIAEAAGSRNTGWIFDEDGEQTDSAWIPQEYAPDPSEPRPMEVVLSDRVSSGDLFGFAVLGAGLFGLDDDADRTFEWHTETTTYDDLPDWLEGVVNNSVKTERLTSAGFDPEQLARLSRYDHVRTLGLTQIDDTGQVQEAKEADKLSDMVVPAALVMIMFMLVMMSTPALLNNVLEEKMQKIAEVLVSAVTPFDLLMGKLLSAVLVSLTLAVVYLGPLLVIAHTWDQVPPQIVAALGAAPFAWFGVFLLLSLLIYGSVFSALGAACSELQDAQTLMTPAMMLLIFPIFFLGPVLEDPTGTLARVLSFIPPATPVIMFLRITVPPGVELWEMTVALTGAILFTLLCVKGASKVFRIGILAQGQAPSYRQLLSWITSK